MSAPIRLIALLVLAAGLGGVAQAQGESLERLFLVDLQRKIREDEAFAGRNVQVNTERGPLALLTDDLPKQRESRFYVPWMEKLAETLRASYLRPLQLGRRTTHPVTPVVVLREQRAYQHYLDKRGHSKAHWTPSSWDPVLKSVVCYPSNRGPWGQRSAVLRDFVFGLLEAHVPRDATPDELWFRRGLACYLSYHLGTTTAELDRHRPDRAAVKFLFEVLRKPDRRAAFWIPLDELWRVTEYASLDNSARGDDPSVAEVFDMECALMLHFLQHGKGGAYQPGVGPYLGHALAGTGDGASFEQCFGTRDLAALERELEDYILELFEELFVGKPKEDEPLEDSDDFEPIDLSGLASETSDVDTALGLALWRARNGRLDDALAALEAFLERAGEEPEVERTLARLRNLRTARDEFLAAGLAGGKRTRLQAGERKINAVIASVADGVIRFAAEDEEPLAIDDIDSVALALTIGEPRPELGPGRLRAFALALGQDGRWKRFLRDESEAGATLQADIETRFDELLAGGRLASALHDLATLGTPRDAAAARVSNRALRELLSSERARAQIAPHLATLGALARRSLALAFLEEGLQQSLGGAVEALGDGRIRLTYDFSDEAQTADFEDFPDYLEWRREKIKGDFSTEKFTLKSDAWRGRGKHCFRHRLRFEAPMRFAYEFTIEKSKSGSTDAAEFLFGICDDGEESWLGCYGQGELHIQNKRLGTYDSIGVGEEPAAFFVKHPHELEIRHDGSRVSTWREGEKRQESPALGLKSGYVFVWLTLGGYVRLDNFVIEGRPARASLAELEEAWVAGELAKLGLE